jgi:WD40 repeat protein
MTLKIWRSANKSNENDFAEFYCAKTLIGHEHSVSFVHNIKDTDISVSCSRDSTIKFWDR